MATSTKYWTSVIGCKVIMAVSGLGLIGFLLAHLAGNLLVFLGPEAINLYAKTLRDYLVVLWILRLGLIAILILHLASAYRLWLLNRAARSIKYKIKRYQETTIAARSMNLSGMVILAFVFYHLAHLTFRLTHPQLQELGDYDVYAMMILSFKSPYVSGFYIIAILLLMAHLSHGINSFLQTLGWSTEKSPWLIRNIGASTATLLAAGFVSIPLAIYLGWLY